MTRYRVNYIVCDGCGASVTDVSVVQLREAGWTLPPARDGRDLCAECTEKAAPRAER